MHGIVFPEYLNNFKFVYCLNRSVDDTRNLWHANFWKIGKLGILDIDSSIKLPDFFSFFVVEQEYGLM